MELDLTLRDAFYIGMIIASVVATHVAGRAGMKHYVRDRIDEINKASRDRTDKLKDSIGRLNTEIEVQRNKLIVLEEIYGSVNELIQQNLRNLKKGGERDD